MTKQIVKVQLSLETTADRRQMLIYNEDRSIQVQMDADSKFITELNDYPKGYYWAELIDGVLNFHDRAPKQSW